MVNVTESEVSTIVASKEDFVRPRNPYGSLVSESEPRIGRDHTDRRFRSQDVQESRVEDLEER